jgi:hypothetical protein
MSRQMRLLALFTMLASLAAVGTVGCGSEGGAGLGSASAEFAPANAAVYGVVDTDFESEQWNNARSLIDRFPDGDRAIDFILGELEKEGISFDEDIRPALGPEVGFVILDLEAEEFVAFTQPRDKAKLERLLETSDEPVVTREIEGWTVVAETDAHLNSFEQARASSGSLASSDAFTSAMDHVTDDAIARFYVSGQELQTQAEAQGEEIPPAALETFFPDGEIPSFGFAVSAEENGVRFEGASKMAEEFINPYEAQLPDEVPGGALLYVSFNDLEQLFSQLRDVFAATDPEAEADIARLENMLGLSLEEDIAPLFANEGALYIRSGGFLPEFTLILNVDDEQAAVGTVDDLVEGLRQFAPELSAPRTIDIAGVEAREVPVDQLAIYYAAFDGHLVVTSSQAGIADLREDGDRLSDDEDFAAALDAVDMPTETLGFAYVNLGEIIAAIFPFLGGEDVPAEVRRNLEPLEHLVFYSSEDGDAVKFVGLLSVD